MTDAERLACRHIDGSSMCATHGCYGWIDHDTCHIARIRALEAKLAEALEG